VVLKISGDGFCREGESGINIDVAARLAHEVRDIAALGVQTAVVVGGGNILRGAQFSKRGFNQSTADQMGMLATVVNALALQDLLERSGCQTRVMTAIPMAQVAEPFIRRRAVRHLEKGRIIILAAGTGNPHFTTDTAAALRAAELQADVLLKATKVDGVYSADPYRDPSARRFHKLTYLEFLNLNLRVMDSTAISLCMENGIPIIVLNLRVPGNLVRVVRGEQVGTLVCAAGTPTETEAKSEK
jgi:uridylate kinase